MAAAVAAVTVAALGFGALTAHRPQLAVALLVALVAIPLALSPLGTLAMLLGLTAIVPFHVHNRFGIGPDPGLLAIDVLVLVGLGHVAVDLVRRRSCDVPMAVALVALVLPALQFFHGVLSDVPLNEVGTETRRVALTLGAVPLALLVLERKDRRRRLGAAMVAIGFALGLWGLAQWYLGVSFGGEGDLGVRDAVPFTTTGRGQLQGGLFAFPVVVVMCFAALISGHLPRAWRLPVWVVLGMNALALLFTYERTFWGGAVLGMALVLLRERPAGRFRGLVAAPLALALIAAVLFVTAPGDLLAASQRLASVTQFQTDESVEYREKESVAVAGEVEASPVIGHGFGAGVSWEAVSQGVGETTTYSHNGYLWLAWKMGIPASLLIFGGMLGSALRRSGARSPSFDGAMRRGAQGSLLALLIVNVTFPSLNALGIGIGTGLLVALCWRPARL